MDAQKTIKKYIVPKTQTIISTILVVVAIVLAVLGVVAMKGADTEALEFYPNDSETGTMGYIDVVGISDWLYQYDSAVYYTALDAEGYLYIVRLSDKQFKELAPQLEYFNDETDTVAMPEAFRLEGLVSNISSDARSTIAEVWQLTTAEYDQYFGAKYLDATTDTAAAAFAPWLVFAMISGLFGLVFLILSLRAAGLAKKCLNRLEELGLTERAAQQAEFADSNTLIGKNRGMLSQEFLFGKGTGVVVPYSDILWCYQLDRKRNFIPVNSYLMVGTKSLGAVQAVDLNRNDRNGVIAEAIDHIAQHNPEAMVGYSRELAKAFNAIVKAK